jgi:hypothetical protein
MSRAQTPYQHSRCDVTAKNASAQNLHEIPELLQTASAAIAQAVVIVGPAHRLPPIG